MKLQNTVMESRHAVAEAISEKVVPGIALQS